jgi:hypothetical protein
MASSEAPWDVLPGIRLFYTIITFTLREWLVQYQGFNHSLYFLAGNCSEGHT